MSAAMLSVAEAQARIKARMQPLPFSPVPLLSCLNRVLASSACAQRDQPPVDVSAMDGYALRSDDIASGVSEFVLRGAVAAGEAPPHALPPGEAMRIFTGAALPQGADMVALQESANVHAGRVQFRDTAATPFKHVRRAGNDFRHGAALLSSGHRLTPRDIALAAAMDLAALDVRRAPRVTVIANGNELTRPSAPKSPYQITAASLEGLLGQLQQWGALATTPGILPDDLSAIRDGVAAAAEGADLVITLGGASVGEHDLMRTAVEAIGGSLDFWRIAMRPGKPLFLAQVGSTPILGLPGNPVSAMVCALLFVKTALNALEGDAAEPTPTASAALGANLPANDSRQDYLRAALRDGEATPLATQDSSQLRLFAQAECLIVRPPHALKANKGDMVPVHIL